MDNLTKFNRKKYNDTFNLIYRTTVEQKENGSITIESLEALLRDQYVYSELDWLGRGEIKEIINQATVAALESIFFQWKDELENK